RPFVARARGDDVPAACTERLSRAEKLVATVDGANLRRPLNHFHPGPPNPRATSDAVLCAYLLPPLRRAIRGSIDARSNNRTPPGVRATGRRAPVLARCRMDAGVRPAMRAASALVSSSRLASSVVSMCKK